MTKQAKAKKFLISSGRRMEMQAMANLTGVPEQYVTEAYTKSFITGGRVHDLLQIVQAWLEADKEGRDYTPIFWHRTDDGVLHLTMWDMNKPEPYLPEAWFKSNPMAFSYGSNTATK